MESSRRSPSDNRSPWLSAIALSLIILGTFAALWPVLGCDFTVRDDHLTVSENPLLKPPTLAGVLRYWKASAWELYTPVTYTVWSGVALLSPQPLLPGDPYKLDPRIFHTTNLTVHLLTALVAWFILRRLFKNIFASVIGSLLFALHPIQVESVAWVSGLKDVLGGCFALIAVWQYVIWAEGEPGAPIRRAHYLLCLAATALAVLSKVSAAMLPGILIAIDWYLLRRPASRIARSVIPVVVICVPAMIVGRLIQQPESLIKLWQSPMVALSSITFYMSKIVWPFQLAPDYDLAPQKILASKWIWACWILPSAAAAVLWLLRRRRPELIAGAAIVLVSILPVLGFLPFINQAESNVTDHYLYLGMFGVAVMVAGTLARLTSVVANLFAASIVVGLGFIGNQQARHWQDMIVLYTHNANVTPHNWRPHAIIGSELFKRRQLREAEAEYRASLALEESADAYTGLGNVLVAQGQFREAIACFHEGIKLRPNMAALHLQLADAYLRYNTPADAEASARRALELTPYDPQAKRLLATALERQGKR